MSTDNERELRDRLGVALDTIEPSLAPTAAVLRRGRSIRARRRAGVAAGLAVLAVLGATLPGVIGHRSPPPLNHRHPGGVTVNPPGTSQDKLTFSGTINDKPWRFSLSYSGPNLMQTDPGGSTISTGLSSGTDGEPTVLDDDKVGPVTYLAGPVSRNVVRLVLRLPGGASLELDPVRWHGHRWVGLAVPSIMQLGRITAYSDRGEIAHAIPFGHDGFNRWLRPGQRGLPRQTAQVGSGTVDGKRWSVTGYVGPWGLCFQESDQSGECDVSQASRLPKGALTALMSCGGTPPPLIALGQAAATVSYLRVRLSDGSVHQIPAVPLAGRRYFGFATGANVKYLSWTAYGASGQRLGSGNPFTPC